MYAAISPAPNSFSVIFLNPFSSTEGWMPFASTRAMMLPPLPSGTMIFALPLDGTCSTPKFDQTSRKAATIPVSDARLCANILSGDAARQCDRTQPKPFSVGARQQIKKDLDLPPERDIERREVDAWSDASAGGHTLSPEANG